MAYVICGLILAAVGYEWLYRKNVNAWHSIEKLDRIFEDFDHLEGSPKAKMIIRFRGTEKWFAVGFCGEEACRGLCLGLPRVKYSKSDYDVLRRKFEDAGFEFEVRDESSRWYAEIPLPTSEPLSPRARVAGRAARVFLDALALGASADFQRSWE